jgi:hypothetical protein
MGVFLGVGYGQMSIVISTPGAPANLVVTHGFEDVPGTGLAATAAAAWKTAMTAAGRILLPANYSNEFTVVRFDATIMTATGPVIGSAASGVVGTSAITCCPLNTAILVNKSTARGGRRGRGRMFWPAMFVAEGNVGAAGTIAAPQLATLNTLFQDTHTALLSTNYPPFLLHDVSEVAPDGVQNWLIQSKVATQRTRLRK